MGGVLLAVLSLIPLMAGPTAEAAAGTNQQINFQGKVVNPDGTNIPNGTYNIEFKIYQDGDGALGGGDETLKWTESRLRDNSQGVTITDGIFQVNLGSVNSTLGSAVDFNQDTLWLSINLGNTNASCTPFSGCAPDGEMDPFIRFTSAPYAMNSGKLNGLTSSQFVQLAQGVQTDSSTASSIFLNKTGATGNIIQLQDAGTDAFVVGNAGNTSINTNSATALTVQNGSNNAFGVDTSNIKVAIGLSTASASSRLSVAGQGAANGITLGDGATGSANLYVSANDTLKTDDALIVGTIGSGGTNLLCYDGFNKLSTCSNAPGAGAYLAKNATDTSSAAVTAANYLYGFTNSSSAIASGVLNIDNGTNTGNALRVTTSGNPGAGNALIFASNNHASPSGNLLDLQSGSSPTSVFSVSADGVTTSASQITSNYGDSGQIILTRNNPGGEARIVLGNSGQVYITHTNANELSVTGSLIIEGASSNLTVQGTGTSNFVGNVDIAGTLKAGTSDAFQVGATGVVNYVAGSTDTAAAVCRNAAGQLAGCNTTGNGAAFIQGGNAFAATAVLGTNDANGLQIVTGSGGPNGRAYFDTSNNLYLGNAGTTGLAAAPNAFTISGTGSSAAAGGAAGGNLTIKAGLGTATGSGSAGGVLALAGGAAQGDGTVNRNGGNLTLDGGAKVGAGGTIGNIVLQGSGGNVGIGATPTTTARLQVSGNIELINDNDSLLFGNDVTTKYNGTDLVTTLHNTANRYVVSGTATGAVLSVANFNNTDTNSSGGAGFLFSAGTTSAFIGGVVSQRIDAANNSRTAIRVLSNGVLSGSDAAAPFYLQGSNSNGITAYFGARTAIFKNDTDSPTALQVQNVIGTSIFNVDTANSKIGTANSTTASTAALTIKSGDASIGSNLSSGNVVIDSGTATGSGTAGSISIGAGAYAHNTTIGNTTTTSSVMLQAGSTGGINIGTVGSATTGSTIHIADTSSGTGIQNITIGSSANSANFVTLQGGAGGGVNLLANGSSNNGVVVRTTTSNSSQAFQIQNSASSSIFTADTSTTRITIGGASGTLSNRNLEVVSVDVTSVIRIGDATNGVSYNDAATGVTGKLRKYGTARESRTITLAPEYAGVVLTGDGTNNTGTMTSDYCSGTSRRSINTSICAANDEFNYYSWTAQATNDYDVWIRWQVPSDFSSWTASNPIQFYGWRSSSSANNVVTLTMYNASGSVCGTATSITNTTTWTATNYSSSGCSPAAGEIMTIRITLSVGVNNEFVRVSNISLNYLSAY